MSSDFKAKLYRVLFALASILILILLIESCEQKKQNATLLNNLSSLNIENQSFKTEINSNNEEISRQDQIILTQKQAIDNGLIEIKKLKNIKSKVRVVTQTKIDTLFIPYDRIVVDSTSGNVIDYAKFFNYKEPKGWYSINGYSNNTGISIDSVRIKNDFSIYIADRKLGLFKQPQPSVILINKNPYTETINMQNVVITIDKPFYKRNAFWGAVGLVGGYLITK